MSAVACCRAVIWTARQHSPAARLRDAPLDMIDIMLEPASHGGYEIAGTAAGVKNIQASGRLLEVAGKDVAQAPFPHVIQWLSGSPGEPHTLVLQRGGNRVTIHATAQSVFGKPALPMARITGRWRSP